MLIVVGTRVESSYVLSVFVCWLTHAVLRVVPCHAGCADTVPIARPHALVVSTARLILYVCKGCTADGPSEASGVHMVPARTAFAE